MKTINELQSLLNKNQEAFWNLVFTSKDSDWPEDTLTWLLNYVESNPMPKMAA